MELKQEKRFETIRTYLAHLIGKSNTFIHENTEIWDSADAILQGFKEAYSNPDSESSVSDLSRYKARIADSSRDAYLESSNSVMEVIYREQAANHEQIPPAAKVKVPTVFAALDTIMTYLYILYVEQDQLYTVKAASKDDIPGATYLNILLNWHAETGKHLTNLSISWRDAMMYGIGIVHPTWEDKNDSALLFSSDTTSSSDSEFSTIQLINIHPRYFIYDTTVASGETHKGIIGGYRQEYSYEAFANEFYEDQVYNEFISANDKLRSKTNTYADTSVTRWVIYAKIVPKRYGLSGSKKQEIWVFEALSQDFDGEISIQKANKADIQIIPFFSGSPDSNGYDLKTETRLNLVFPLDRFINFLMNGFVKDQEKSLNGTYIVDPTMIDPEALKDRSPGKIIPLRRDSVRLLAGGRQKMAQDAVYQLSQPISTENNVALASLLGQFVQSGTGATEAAQGIVGKRTSRISASEANNTLGSAANRLNKLGQVLYDQAIMPMVGYMAQLIRTNSDKATTVRLNSEREKFLRDNFNIHADSGYLPISDTQILANVHVTSVRLGQDSSISDLIEFARVSKELDPTGQFIDVGEVLQLLASKLSAETRKVLREQLPPQIPGNLLNPMQNQNIPGQGIPPVDPSQQPVPLPVDPNAIPPPMGAEGQPPQPQPTA